MIDKFIVVDDCIQIEKTPGAELYYGINLADWLSEIGQTLQSCSATAVGVSIMEAAAIQGTIVYALIGGLDLADGAENSCTLSFVCADGKSKDSRTLHFTRRPS
jgi:hypothetical protein